MSGPQHGLPGVVCDCGEPVNNFEILNDEEDADTQCPQCGEKYGE